MTKQISIRDFLSAAQLCKAMAIYNAKPADLHKRLLNEVILPNMAQINRKLGQENDPGYLAYAVEYVLSVNERR